MKIEGKWDVIVKGSQGDYASWFEITCIDGKLGGRFVGIQGSARPIESIRFKDNELYFQLPPQYEKHKGDLVFKGKLLDGAIVGETNDDAENWIKFYAVQAPQLKYRDNIEWGGPITLIRNDFSNWSLRKPEGPDGWKIENGILSNATPSVDLLTKERYNDFKLHVDFKIPECGNSGIYLRGRYEVQIADDHHQEPGPLSTGSIYGYLTPQKKAAKPVGEWNTYDITLVGRHVTIELNGQIIIKEQEIPGLTGGALDSLESEPGPIMLQGDHTSVEFRNFILILTK